MKRPRDMAHPDPQPLSDDDAANQLERLEVKAARTLDRVAKLLGPRPLDSYRRVNLGRK